MPNNFAFMGRKIFSEKDQKKFFWDIIELLRSEWEVVQSNLSTTSHFDLSNQNFSQNCCFLQIFTFNIFNPIKANFSGIKK